MVEVAVWIYLAQESDKWGGVAGTVANFRVPEDAGNFVNCMSNYELYCHWTELLYWPIFTCQTRWRCHKMEGQSSPTENPLASQERVKYHRSN
jgi:hypothetical protein